MISIITVVKDKKSQLYELILEWEKVYKKPYKIKIAKNVKVLFLLWRKINHGSETRDELGWGSETLERTECSHE